MDVAGRTLARASWRGSDTQPRRLNSGGRGGYFNVVALQQKHALHGLLNERRLFLKPQVVLQHLFKNPSKNPLCFTAAGL